MEDFEKQWKRLLKKRKMAGVPDDRGIHLAYNGESWLLMEVQKVRSGDLATTHVLSFTPSLAICLNSYEEKLDNQLKSEMQSLRRRTKEIQQELGQDFKDSE